MKRNRSKCMRLGVLLCLTGAISSAYASNDDPALCLDGVCFQSRLQLGSSEVSAVGIGKYEVFFFDVYTAVFYASPNLVGASLNDPNYPRALVLHYHRSLEPEDFREAASEAIADNPLVDLDSVQPGLEQMSAMYMPVEPGDRYMLTYSPLEGTKLFYNGALLGSVPGIEFANAYFGIWLSQYSVSDSLRKRLLRST